MNLYRDHSPPFLKHPPLYPTWPLFKIFISLPFKTFYTVPSPHLPATNLPSSYYTPTSPKPSQWRYLFPATNHSHLNSDQTYKNLIHSFSFCYMIRVVLTFVTYWFSDKELWRKKKIYFRSNIWHNLNGKINLKMITLKKLVRKSINLPFLFKKTHPPLNHTSTPFL